MDNIALDGLNRVYLFLKNIESRDIYSICHVAGGDYNVMYLGSDYKIYYAYCSINGTRIIEVDKC